MSSHATPEDGPPARTRGVRWDRNAPAGYRRLTAHNSAGVLVFQHDILEELVDPGLVGRAWKWLDEKCPEAAEDIPPERTLRLA